VTRFRQGDEVFGTCRSGSFAEYATAREDRLAPKPQKLRTWCDLSAPTRSSTTPARRSTQAAPGMT